MRRFRFRLETALRLRRLAEQEAQTALADAQRRIAAAETDLTERLERRRRHLACQERLLSARVDTALLRASSTYAQALDEEIDEARGRLGEAIAEAEARRDRLRQRRADREALETLRERRLQEHQSQERADEQAWLDETAILRRERP